MLMNTRSHTSLSARFPRAIRGAAMLLTGAALATAVGVSPAAAQQQQKPRRDTTGAAETALQKASQNPVGDLMAIPLQFNFYSGGYLVDRSSTNFNFQPIIPVSIGKDWNLISRTIVPFFDIPIENDGRSKGMGDIQEQLFISPSKHGEFTWGVGPVLQMPTATNDLIRTGDWALGPGVAALWLKGPLVIGGLVTQIWKFAGTSAGSSVNFGTIQPFIYYNLPYGWAIQSNPEITVNWTGNGNKWTIPLGGGVSKIIMLGHQPINASIQYYNQVQATPGSGRNLVRLQASLLFPKGL